MSELLLTIVEGILRLLDTVWHVRDLWRNTQQEYQQNKRLSRDTWMAWTVILTTLMVCLLIVYWAMA